MKFSLRSISAQPILHGADAPARNGKMLGYVLAALGAVLFAMKAILIKLAYQSGGGLEANELDTITLLALRMGFSLPVYAVIGVWVVRQRRKQGKPLAEPGLFVKAALLGMLGYYICAGLDFTGLKYITAQLERLLLFTYPAFVIVLGAIFFGGKLPKYGVASIIIAYAGIALIFAGGDIASGINVPLGAALVLTCAFLFALFQLLAKPQIDRIGSSLFTCASMVGASAVIFTHFVTVNLMDGSLFSALDLPPRIWVLGAMIALVSTILPSFFVNIALGRIGAQAVATLGMISPIATIVAAVVILGEPFGGVDALGTALTIFGIGLYTWFDKRARPIPKALLPATDK